MVAGACGGFLLGIEFNLLLQSPTAFWTINITCAVTVAILAIIFFHHLVILSTSFIGSYFFVRGITVCITGTTESEITK